MKTTRLRWAWLVGAALGCAGCGYGTAAPPAIAPAAQTEPGATLRPPEAAPHRPVVSAPKPGPAAPAKTDADAKSAAKDAKDAKAAPGHEPKATGDEKPATILLASENPPREVPKAEPPADAGKPVMRFEYRGSDGPARGASADEPPRKYKTPNLPAGLPPWFSERDRDGDGQVGLYEWPRDGLADFGKYDRNGDGFITPDEALRALGRTAVAKGTPPGNPSGPSASGTPTGAPASSPPAATAAGSPASPGATPVGPPSSVTMTADLSGRGGAERPMLFTFGPPGEGGDRSKQFAEGLMKRHDKNGDGKLDETEIQTTTMLKNSWKQYDANRDGAIDLEELTAFTKNMFSNMRPPGGGGGDERGRSGRPGGEERRGTRFPMQSPEERARDFLGRYDKNSDGKVSADEMPEFLRGRMNDWDTNKDGFVDTQELKAAFESFGRGRGRPQ